MASRIGSWLLAGILPLQLQNEIADINLVRFTYRLLGSYFATIYIGAVCAL